MVFKTIKNPKLAVILRAYYDLASDGIVFATKKRGLIYHANPIFLHWIGYTLKEVKRKPFINLVHSDDVEKTIQAMIYLQEGGRIEGFENRYITKSGKAVTFIWNSVIISNTYLARVTKKEP